MEVKATLGDRPGYCTVPCILDIDVTLLPGDFASIEYQLEASIEEKFSLLVDGAMPLQFVARPGKPAGC